MEIRHNGRFCFILVLIAIQVSQVTTIVRCSVLELRGHREIVISKLIFVRVCHDLTIIVLLDYHLRPHLITHGQIRNDDLIAVIFSLIKIFPTGLLLDKAAELLIGELAEVALPRVHVNKTLRARLVHELLTSVEFIQLASSLINLCLKQLLMGLGSFAVLFVCHIQ